LRRSIFALLKKFLLILCVTFDEINRAFLFSSYYRSKLKLKENLNLMEILAKNLKDWLAAANKKK